MASQETFKDFGCSSSEEDGNRADTAEGTAEEKTSPVAVRRRHPFSVEALMSGREADDRGAESTCCKPEGSSVAVCPVGLHSLYLCRETCSLPGGSRKSLTAAPSSPVKSEASESEDCAPWVTSSAFSTQPRELLLHDEALRNFIDLFFFHSHLFSSLYLAVWMKRANLSCYSQ